MKTVVITGCSTGLGRAAALRLAGRGWQVFATVRKEADQASLAGGMSSTAYACQGQTVALLAGHSHLRRRVPRQTPQLKKKTLRLAPAATTP